MCTAGRVVANKPGAEVRGFRSAFENESVRSYTSANKRDDLLVFAKGVRVSIERMVRMLNLDEAVRLGTGEFITPRQLIAQGRAALRRSLSHRPAGATEPREAWWLDIVYLTGPHAPEGIEISEEQYADYLEMGVPEIPLG